MLKFKYLLTAAVSAASLGSAAGAAVTTLDFDAARGRNGNTGYVYGPYHEDGFTVTADRCSSQNTCYVTTGTTLSSLDRVGAALVNYLGSAVSTVAREDGAAFLLNSMDMADNNGNFSGYAQPTDGVQFTFNFLDGSRQVVDYTLLNTPGQRLTPNTLVFNFGPLLSFSWKPTTNTGGFLQFDNIRLSDAAAAVPEPTTWAMMIAGFGLVGGTMRRRAARPALA